MGISPDTLSNLYNQGILDYAPYELCGGANVSSLTQGSNPYMQTAMQGGLYRNYGAGADSFTSNSGMISQGGMSGSTANNALNGGFGLQGYGSQSQAGVNGFGLQGYGTQSQAGVNGFGGGFGKLGQAVSQTPSMIKGLIAGGIILGTTILCLKKGKKAPVNKQGFFSKFHIGKKK